MAAIDTHAWLQAIDDHPNTSADELLAAYGLLGVAVDMNTHQADAAVLGLQHSGFLRVVEVGGNT